MPLPADHCGSIAATSRHTAVTSLTSQNLEGQLLVVLCVVVALVALVALVATVALVAVVEEEATVSAAACDAPVAAMLAVAEVTA